MSDIRELSAALAIKAAKELNEDPNKIEPALREFRQWILTQTHLRARTNNQFLIIFLRAAKYNLNNAKKRLENYYVYRKFLPELFQNRNINLPQYKAIIESGSIAYLTEPIAEDGPRVILILLNKFNMQLFSMLDVYKLGAMLSDIIIQEDDNAVVAGYVVIMDFSNIPKQVLKSIDPILARKTTILINKASPARLKGFHFINVPYFFEKIFNMVKGVIHTKLKNRFYVHNGNYENLYNYVPRHILPQEFGGDVNLEILQEQMWNKFRKSQDLISEEDTYGVIESHFKTLESDAIFGAQGSFRTLDID